MFKALRVPKEQRHLLQVLRVHKEQQVQLGFRDLLGNKELWELKAQHLLFRALKGLKDSSDLKVQQDSRGLQHHLVFKELPLL